MSSWSLIDRTQNHLKIRLAKIVSLHKFIAPNVQERLKEAQELESFAELFEFLSWKREIWRQKQGWRHKEQQPLFFRACSWLLGLLELRIWRGADFLEESEEDYW